MWAKHKPPDFARDLRVNYGSGQQDVQADGFSLFSVPDTAHGTCLQVAFFRFCGWPMRSLYGCHFYQCWPRSSRPPLNNYCGLPIGPRNVPFASGMCHERWLPYLPIWPGFAVNTLCYGAILWLVLAVLPATLRRHFRRKRGRCLKCGYDLRGDLDKGCPECGWKREEAAT